MPDKIMDIMTADPTDVLRRFDSDLKHSTEYRKFYADRWFRYYKKYRNKHDKKFLQYREDKFTIFVPLIFSLVESLIPRFMLGTFGSYPFIHVNPVGAEDIEGSKKAERLLNTQLSRDNVLLKAVGWFKQFSMYGSSPSKVVWKEDYATIPLKGGNKKILRYIGPSLITMDVFDLLVDPKATDEGIPSASYVIHTIILSEEEMKVRVSRAKEYQYKFSGIDWESEGIYPTQEMYEKWERERVIMGTSRESTDRKYWRFDEYWTRDGLITIMNKKHMIRRVPNTLLDYPFINLNRNPLLGEFYGIGDIESVEDLMDEINYLRNLRLDNIDLIVNCMWLVERSALVNKEELVARAGKTIDTNDVNGVKQLIAQDMTGPCRQEEDRLKLEMQEVSGLVDLLKGMPAKGMAETMGGMAMLIEGASHRIKLGLMMIEHYGIRQLGDKFMRLNYLNLPNDYMIKTTGESDWLKLKTPDEIFGNYDFIPSGSSEFINMETLRQSILQLYNLLARDPQVDQVGLKKLLAMAFGGRMLESILLGGGGASPDPIDDSGEEGMIMKENEQMLQGQEIPPVGDHNLHIQGHQSIMQEIEFSQMGSDIQGIFGRHVEGHRRALGTGAPLENPERFAAKVGRGTEETQKEARQLPTRG